MNAAVDPLVLVNVTECSVAEPFADLPVVAGRPVLWRHHSGLARNALERRISRPRLSRYRAAVGAIADAGSADALVSHMPLMSAAVEHMARTARRHRPHLALSFNFTRLPQGATRRQMRSAFRSIEQFCVYSNHERHLYADYFGIDPARLRHVIWTQDVPVYDNATPVPPGPYIAAIGGEGRDYAALVAAARARPDIRFVLIARPSALLSSPPANMTVHINLPAQQAWAIGRGAAAVAIPLVTAETCCGHITIVAAQQLGIPVILTETFATEEYVEGFGAVQGVRAGNVDDLASAAAAAIENVDANRARAMADIPLALARYDRSKWSAYLGAFLQTYAMG